MCILLVQTLMLSDTEHLHCTYFPYIDNRAILRITVIFVGNRISNPSSNPASVSLHFTSCYCP